MKYVERATLLNRRIHPQACCENCSCVYFVSMKTGDSSSALQYFCLCDLMDKDEELSKAYDTINEGLAGKHVEDLNYSTDVYKLFGIPKGKSYKKSLRYVSDPMSVCQYYEMFF